MVRNFPRAMTRMTIGRRLVWPCVVALSCATNVFASTPTSSTAPREPSAPVAPATQAERHESGEGGEGMVEGDVAAGSTPFLVDPAGPSAGCVIDAYAQCLGLDRGGCETLTRTAAEAANAEIAAEAAKVSPERAASPFFEGVAIGIFVRHMERLSDGRFLDCAPKAR